MGRGSWIVLAAALQVGGTEGTAPQEGPVDAETLRVRDRAVVLDVRTVMMAARLFAARNGAYYGPFECLTRPETCLPGFPPEEAPFLDPTHDWLETRHGYERKYHLGPKAGEGDAERVGAVAESYRSFAFTAVPARPGQTGIRAFCGDSSGKICFTADGSPPGVRDGKCAPPCKELK